MELTFLISQRVPKVLPSLRTEGLTPARSVTRIAPTSLKKKTVPFSNFSSPSLRYLPSFA